MRPLSKNEIDFIRKVADRLPPAERHRLLEDLEVASVSSAASGDAIVQFQLAGYERPVYEGQHSYGVEGRVNNQDGSELLVILHADANGRLLELELVRFDVGDVISPDWSSLQIW